jgi:hypothetical protein
MAKRVNITSRRIESHAKITPVYIGKTAGLAFLHFLRQILSEHMGPSQFTENMRGDVMLEAQLPDAGPPELNLSLEEKALLIDGFFLAVSILSLPASSIYSSN